MLEERHTRRLYLILGIVVGITSSVFAADVSVNYAHTAGSLSFDDNSVSANLDFLSGFYFGGSYEDYRFDGSSGTIKTYGLRLGRYSEGGSWKLFGSVTPEVSNYKETSAGGEFHARILGGHIVRRPPLETEQPGPGSTTNPQEQPPASTGLTPELDFIGGYARTMYVDTGQKVNENDVTGGLGLTFFQTALTGTFTKSVYDEEFSGNFNLNTRRFDSGYTPTILPGYPDYNYTATIDQTLIPHWWYAMGSYEHLQYKAGPDENANVFTIGTGLTLFRYLTGNISYSRYIPATRATENYLTIGAGLRF